MVGTRPSILWKGRLASDVLDEGRQIKLYIVDNHRLVRNGLKALLADFSELEIVGTAAAPSEALEECRSVKPDVILVEVMVEDGIELIQQLTEASPTSAIVVLTYLNGSTPIYEALQAGVKGYLIKDISTEQLVEAIAKVNDGTQVIAQELVPDLIEQSVNSDSRIGEDLTEREREVLALLPSGLSNKEIAEALGISTSTIKNHISNILAKLETDSRVEAVAIALRNKIVT